jgi:GrpB-like predicted nucleotidyltransferase (UPF0157 family)
MDRDDLNAYLDAVLIGGRDPVRSITIADYDPTWPARFERERARIEEVLEGIAIRIEHIGSTAVPGLAAKPIVDILVTVEKPDNEAAFVPALTDAGFDLRVREPGHRMFRTPQRDVHVHVWADNDVEVGRYLALRDRLRSSPEERETYERLKRELAAVDWESMDHYAEAKGELIEALLARAAASHRRR